MALINLFNGFWKCKRNGMSLLLAEDWPVLQLHATSNNGGSARSFLRQMIALADGLTPSRTRVALLNWAGPGFTGTSPLSGPKKNGMGLPLRRHPAVLPSTSPSIGVTALKR